MSNETYNKNNAELHFFNKKIELPIIHGTEGPSALVIKDLYTSTNGNMLTYDPGFMSTASCHSKITYIDGESGILMHRGYAIAELAEHSNFLEVCYLLIYGELPNKAQYDEFVYEIIHSSLVHESISDLIKVLPEDAHPMSILLSAVGALAAFYHQDFDIKNSKHREKTIIRVIAKIANLAAMTYKHTIGQPFIYPDNSLSYGANLLKMMFGLPTEPYHVNPVCASVIEKLLILHADHEQNASTSTVRLIGSSGANPFAAISGGIASLWGPAHGGANEEVLKMLQEIRSVDRIAFYIDKAKDKNSNFRLMGFGHRVYKNYDPRASVLKEYCHKILKELKAQDDELLNIAVELERIALSDSYFIERKLYPNVDFYSGIIYRALKIPVNMFTVMFAIARTAGWMSQWNEMVSDPDQKIGRPRQIYQGYSNRPYIPMNHRK